MPGFIGSLMLFIVPISALLVSYQRSSITFSFIPLVIFCSLAFVIAINGISLFFHWRKFQILIPIFMGGSEMIGQVVDVHFSRGRGYITYEYEYQQGKYRFTDTINQNERTKEITIGQKIVLYVNQEKPAQAFIRDLYLNTF